MYCRIFNLQSGQLSVRDAPAGNIFAGLDNGNVVALGSRKTVVAGGRAWDYIRVIQGPNPGVNGREGWASSDYIDCLTEF